MRKLVFIFLLIQAICPSFLIKANDIVTKPYFIEVKNKDDMNLSDSEFYALSRAVVFPVNKYVIPKDADIRQEMAEQIALMDSLGYHFEGAIVRGAASPEGPLRWNKTLSQRRRLAILNLIGETKVFEDSVSFRYTEMPEDYKYLVYMMEEAQDPDLPVVKSLVEKYAETDIVQLKRELRAINIQMLWRRLFKTYYPALRTGRVVFFVSKNEPEEPKWDFSEFLNHIPYEPVQVVEEEPIEEPVQVIEEPKEQPRRELLSVGTNLLYDLAYMPGYNRFCPIPNVQLEYYPLSGHFTYGGSFECPWWQHYNAHKYFQVRNYQLEGRYYLRSGDESLTPDGSGAAFRGTYFKAYTQLGLYSICFDANRGWEGEGVGVGIGAGYVLPLSRDGHWRLDFGVQFGYLWTKYDPYQYSCPVDPENPEHSDLYFYKTTLGPSLFKKRQHHFNWLGPTRISITITYDLLYRRKKGGPSIHKTEIVK